MKIVKRDIPDAEHIDIYNSILDDMIQRNNVYLYGIKGTGKSYMAESLAYAYNNRNPFDQGELPFVNVSCTRYTSPARFTGGQTAEGYREGAIIEAVRDNKVLILDEMPKLDPNTAGELNAPLAKLAQPGAVIFNGLNQPFKVPENFAVIATGNTNLRDASTAYRGNNKQDSSLRDRFMGNMYQVGYNTKLEQALTYKEIYELCIKIREALEKVHTKDNVNPLEAEDTISLRVMLNFQRTYELEMLRAVGAKDASGKTIRDVPHGKTLEMSVKNFLDILPDTTAKKVKQHLDFDTWVRHYKDKSKLRDFRDEFPQFHPNSPIKFAA